MRIPYHVVFESKRTHLLSRSFSTEWKRGIEACCWEGDKKKAEGRSATSKLACEKGHAGGAVAYIEPAQYFDIKVVWIQGKELLSFTLSFSCLCAIVFVTSKKKRYSFFYLKHQTFFFLQNFSIWKNITFPYGNLSVEKKQKFARNN